METYQCNAKLENPKIQQLIKEFFEKSLHIIVEARSLCQSSHNNYQSSSSPHPSCPSSKFSTSITKPVNKWFNFEFRECPTALQNVDIDCQSNLDQLVVDVVLVCQTPETEPADPPVGSCRLRNLSAKEHYPNCWCPRQEEFLSEAKSREIVERWIVQYESGKNGGSGSDSSVMGGKRSGMIDNLHISEILDSNKRTYKRLVILLRSLYSAVRLLPAYKLFRDLKSSRQVGQFKLTYKISPFAEPFTRCQYAEMTQFCFVPVDTPHGRLGISLSYLKTLENVSLEPSSPLHIQLITDYFDPLADTLKRFESLPISRPPAKPVLFNKHCTRSCSRVPSVSPFPSPAHSESHAWQAPHERLRLRDLPIGVKLKKFFSFGEVDVGYLSRIKPQSCCTPGGVPLPWRSSRLSFLDGHDDSEFECPFADDNDNIRSSKALRTGRSATCKDASIGALVQMLKTAPPLSRDIFGPLKISEDPKVENCNKRTPSKKTSETTSAQGLVKSRTVGDAMEELRSYKELCLALRKNRQCQEKSFTSSREIADPGPS